MIAIIVFFNFGQGGEEEAKNFGEIAYVQSKEDGSMILPHLLPSGRIFCKTRKTFSSDQALMANHLIDKNDYLKEFITTQLLKDIVPIFELVGPFNKIVLDYPQTELILLHLRNNKTGEYILDEKEYERIEIKQRSNMKFLIDQSFVALIEKIDQQEFENFIVPFAPKSIEDFVKLVHEFFSVGL